MSANERQVDGNHYQNGFIQHWDYTWQNGFNQFEYCITKYVERHKEKRGIIDLNKALHFCEKYLELGIRLNINITWSLPMLEDYCSGKNFDEYQTRIFKYIHGSQINEVQHELKAYIEFLSE